MAYATKRKLCIVELYVMLDGRNIMHEMSMAGLFDTANIPDSINTWSDLASELSIASTLSDSDALACLKWLGVFEKNNDIKFRGEVSDAFCSLLEEKLAYGHNEGYGANETRFLL